MGPLEGRTWLGEKSDVLFLAEILKPWRFTCARSSSPSVGPLGFGSGRVAELRKDGFDAIKSPVEVPLHAVEAVQDVLKGRVATHRAAAPMATIGRSGPSSSVRP